MTLLKTGIIGTYLKADEKRVPIPHILPQQRDRRIRRRAPCCGTQGLRWCIWQAPQDSCDQFWLHRSGGSQSAAGTGFTDITLYVLGDPASLRNLPEGVEIVRIEDPDGQVTVHGHPFITERERDVIFNGILQDPLNPLMFWAEDETSRLKHGALISDIS